MAKGKWDAFKAVVDEYFHLNHAERVPVCDLKKPDGAIFYLPMHGVVRESSITTKTESGVRCIGENYHWYIAE